MLCSGAVEENSVVSLSITSTHRQTRAKHNPNNPKLLSTQHSSLISDSNITRECRPRLG